VLNGKLRMSLVFVIMDLIRIKLERKKNALPLRQVANALLPFTAHGIPNVYVILMCIIRGKLMPVAIALTLIATENYVGLGKSPIKKEK